MTDRERSLPCGHPSSAVQTSDEGTSFCADCEMDAYALEVQQEQEAEYHRMVMEGIAAGIVAGQQRCIE